MRIRAILLFAAAVSAPAAFADSITYTISAGASGSIGTTEFSNTTITFTEVSDTTLVGSCPGGGALCTVDSPTNTVTISGIGTFTIGDATHFFDNSNSVAGFSDDTTSGDLLDLTDPAFVTYNLQTAIGPITDTVVYGSGSGVGTSGGLLTFTVNSDDATFQAATTSSPEPGTVSLMLAGGIAMLAAKGRYNARRAKDSRR